MTHQEFIGKCSKSLQALQKQHVSAQGACKHLLDEWQYSSKHFCRIGWLYSGNVLLFVLCHFAAAVTACVMG